jgi:hypothetical protein
LKNGVAEEVLLALDELAELISRDEVSIVGDRYFCEELTAIKGSGSVTAIRFGC